MRAEVHRSTHIILLYLPRAFAERTLVQSFCTISDLKPPQTSTWSKYSPRRPRTASLCWGTAGNRTAAVHLVLGRLGRHGLEEGPVVCAACRLLRAGGFVDHGGMKLRKASDNIWRRMSEPVGKGNGGAPWQYREAIFGRKSGALKSRRALTGGPAESTSTTHGSSGNRFGLSAPSVTSPLSTASMFPCGYRIAGLSE